MLSHLVICLLGLASQLVLAMPHNDASSLEMVVKAASPEPEVCKKPPTSTAGPRPTPTVTITMDSSVRDLLTTKNVVLAPTVYTLPPGVQGVILKATYFYICGLTGSHSRRFTWAAHHGNNNDLVLVAVENVDEFLNIERNVPSAGGYRAVWVAEWDVAYANLCCRYFASGHIEGFSYIEAVTMNLIRLNGPLHQIPYVSEKCHAGGAPPNIVGNSCTITHVQVERL